MSDDTHAEGHEAGGAEGHVEVQAKGHGEGASFRPALSFRNVSFSYIDRGRGEGRGQKRQGRGRQGDRAAIKPAGSEPKESSRPLLIDNLTLDIPAGRVTGIVGPNGCGKSTLLKLADGLLRPSAGSVLVAGDNVAALSSTERARRVAMLPQVHRTPSMSVRDLVMCGRYARMGFFGHPSAEDSRVVDAALAEFSLDEISRQPARSLSGGERQRAFLAMTVAQESDLLLLDEPTTYLDVRAAHETMRLARDLNRRRGITVVAVVHDLDLALRTCDKLVVMTRGSVRAQGKAGDPQVLGAIEQAFEVRVVPVDTPLGRAYAAFPQ